MTDQPRFTRRDAELLDYMLSRRSDIPPSMREMAEGMGIPFSTLVGRVTKAEKYGWVRRSKAKQARSLRVTEEGIRRNKQHREEQR